MSHIVSYTFLLRIFLSYTTQTAKFPVILCDVTVELIRHVSDFGDLDCQGSRGGGTKQNSP